MPKQIYNVVHPREGSDGKTYWEKMGVMVIEQDDTSADPKINIRLDSIPVGKWDGWLKAFPRDERSRGRRDAAQFEQPTSPAASEPPAPNFDMDTPF